MATVANDGVDEVDLDGHGAQIVDPSVPPHLSLRSMMETFMTTKAAHGQLLDKILIGIAALRIDFNEYRSAFPPPPPSDN